MSEEAKPAEEVSSAGGLSTDSIKQQNRRLLKGGNRWRLWRPSQANAANLNFSPSRFESFDVVVFEGGDAWVLDPHHLPHQIRNEQIRLARQEEGNTPGVVILRVEARVHLSKRQGGRRQINRSSSHSHLQSVNEDTRWNRHQRRLTSKEDC